MQKYHFLQNYFLWLSSVSDPDPQELVEKLITVLPTFLLIAGMVPQLLCLLECHGHFFFFFFSSSSKQMTSGKLYCLWLRNPSLSTTSGLTWGPSGFLWDYLWSNLTHRLSRVWLPPSNTAKVRTHHFRSGSIGYSLIFLILPYSSIKAFSLPFHSSTNPFYILLRI